ncbi:O-antigen ligase family protein [Microcoleus vaginatus DQ-U2]|uniref:O-antigen ligase family protein n=1 Tax=Microcoleus vaginatus TaxID=119532 RepID=UPI0016826AC3|nr:O-antigen ligase family protein [Microcoleus sp. FACHB-DQ6]
MTQPVSKAAMLKELILGNSLFIWMLIAIVAIATLLLFQFATRKKIGLALEKTFAYFYIFISPSLTQPPFNYLHLTNLQDTSGSILSMLPYFFYPWIVLILFSRIKAFGTKFIDFFAKVLSMNPFFLLYILLPSLSTLWSIVPDVTLRAGLAFSAFTAFGFYLAAQYKWHDLSRFWRWGYTALGLASFIMKPPGAGDFVGLTLSKNSLGLVLALCTAFWYLHYSQGAKTHKERWISLGMMFFSFYLVRANKSGGALVVTIILILAVSLLKILKKLSFQWAFTTIICFLVVSIIMTVFVVDNLEEIIVGGLGKDLTLTGRTEFWPQLIAAVNQRPWFGYGYDGFFQQDKLGAATPAYFIYTPNGFQPKNPHNGAIGILLAFGWPGLILMMISLLLNLAYAVRYLSRSNLEDAGMPICFLVSIIMSNITEAQIVGIANAWLSYVMLTVRLAIDNASNTSNTSSSNPQRPSVARTVD